MSHTVREKSKLMGRVRRIRGQVEALERALDAEKGCAEVLHQIAAVRGAINGLMAEVLEEHVRTHIADPAITSVVRPRIVFRTATITRSSVTASTFAVGSSNIRSFGSVTRTRARESLWAWPPETRTPLSPTGVSRIIGGVPGGMCGGRSLSGELIEDGVGTRPAGESIAPRPRWCNPPDGATGLDAR